MKIFRVCVARTFVFSLFLAFAFLAQAKEQLVYFGTFPKTGSKGIYVSRLNLETGKFSAPEVAAETSSAGFLAIHPNRQFLYAVGELQKPSEKPSGAVNAFAVDPKTGKLTFLNQQASGGKGPAHLTVDSSGKIILVANYAGGSVAALPIGKDGKISAATSVIQHTGSSVDPTRQKEPHAHSINVDLANHYAFAADLGLDKILIYKMDPAKGLLTANNPAFAKVEPGAGPRHLAFHPQGHYAYVINEMACTVTGFRFDPRRGELIEVQTISTLPDGQKFETGFSTAEVQVHPSGRFLYGSNRGHDSITVFSLETKTGLLKQIQNISTEGKVPRNFGIDPTGEFLLAANQNSDSVTIFRIDQKSGKLTPTGEKLSVPMPVCVKFIELPETDLPAVAQFPTDDQLPGVGPLQKSLRYRSLWTERRTEWWNNREKDKGAVVFLGDSITQRWESLAKDFPGLKIANRGISADTTRGVLARLQEDVLDLEPEAIVLLIGTNDIGLNGTPEDVVANMREILARIKKHNSKTPVILCKVMPSSEKASRPPEELKKLNALVDKLVKGNRQVIRCDTWSIFAQKNGEPKKEEFPDLLHPNAIGYEKWTKALQPIFTQLNLGKKSEQKKS